jgi:hypothetical protein
MNMNRIAKPTIKKIALHQGVTSLQNRINYPLELEKPKVPEGRHHIAGEVTPPGKMSMNRIPQAGFEF